MTSPINSNILWSIYCRFSTPDSALTTPTLTEKQLTVLGFIQGYFSAHRHSPLIREIQQGCQIVSYKSAIDRLNALEHKGYIRRLPNKHRGIRLVKRMVRELVTVQEPAPTAGGMS